MTLLSTFVDASEREKARYTFYRPEDEAEWLVQIDNHPEGWWFDYERDCERFIAKRAAQAGMRALHDAYGLQRINESGPHGLEIFDFLDQLAGDPDGQ